MLVTSDSLFIEKKCLLYNSYPTSVSLIDATYIGILCKYNSYLLLTECSMLFSFIKDANSRFRALQELFAQMPNYKDVALYDLTTVVFERYKNASQPELNNQVTLYGQIDDTELRRELIDVVRRIGTHASTSPGMPPPV